MIIVVSCVQSIVRRQPFISSSPAVSVGNSGDIWELTGALIL
jgi:hypothetical protein